MDPNKGIKQRQYKEWHNDSNNWKFGIIYFNPKDKRLFPPKRVPWAGWTINFANPFSILALLLLLIVLGLLYNVLCNL
jgi:uncharacterized membrane protein